MENPESIGLGALLFALGTAWFKIRPAMRKIESDENASLRGDLFKRITEVEGILERERAEHKVLVGTIREEYERIVTEMQRRHDLICREYEEKLRRFEERVDSLMKQLLERNGRNG